MKGFLRRTLRWAWRAVAVLFVLSLLVPLAYRWIDPPLTPLMLARSAGGAPIRKEWVPLERISPHLIRAAVASEDNNFLGHRGFDIVAIRQAIEEHRRGRRQRGASTISQQTAKNVFLWSGRSWVRKGLEVYFTFLIETLWSKERIMEVYLNVIETGNGIYGAEAAARTYFGRPAARLTRRQAALLTAAYPDPRRRNPARPTAYLTRRAAQIERLMELTGEVNFDARSIGQARERFAKYKQLQLRKRK